MTEYKPSAAENWLAHQLKQQRESMSRRGIDDVEADEQIRALEVAIRCELWRLSAQSGGAA